MEDTKADLSQHYKKVIKCAVCKRYYGSDIKERYETGLCPHCEGKVKRGYTNREEDQDNSQKQA